MSEQRRNLSLLETSITNLADRVQSQQDLLAASSRNIEGKLSQITIQNEKLDENLVANHKAVKNSLDVLQCDVRKTLDFSTEQSAREALLTSLFYPEHNSRKDMLKPAWHDTFDWILDEAKFAGRDERQLWSNYPKWLREGDGVYWVSGKPASGKSTLMAHMLDSPATMSNLATWASGRQLHTLSFFFWRPGSPLQKSVIGLLRSLLLQLLEQAPDISSHIQSECQLVPSRIPSWSENQLRAMMEAAIAAASSGRSCVLIFLDGLDEFDGDVPELIKLLYGLQDCENVKCVVSSRPDAQLKQRLQSCAQLRLEDLNYEDISEFVRAQLCSTDADTGNLSELLELETLAKNVCERAQGVFLWAALTTTSLLRGIAAGDEWSVLWSRLQVMPTDMNKLFEQMLEQVDEVHQRSLAFSFRAMDLLSREKMAFRSRPLSIALLTASLRRAEPANYDCFTTACKITHHAISAQSRGFLETCQEQADESQEVRIVPQNIAHRPSLSSSTPEGRLRILRGRQPGRFGKQIADVLKYSYTTINWIHRTAYDFVFTHQSPVLRDILSKVSEGEVAHSLGYGCMSLLVTGPRLKKGVALNTRPPTFILEVYWTSSTMSTLSPVLGKAAAGHFDELMNVVDNSGVDEFNLPEIWPMMPMSLGLDPSDYYKSVISRAGTTSMLGKDAIKISIISEMVAVGITKNTEILIRDISESCYGPCSLAHIVRTALPRWSQGNADGKLARQIISTVKQCLQMLEQTYQSCTLVPCPSQPCWEFLVLPNSSPDHISWTPRRSADDALASLIEFETLHHLSITFYLLDHFESLGRHTDNTEVDQNDMLTIMELLRPLERLLKAWNLFVSVNGERSYELRFEEDNILPPSESKNFDNAREQDDIGEDSKSCDRCVDVSCLRPLLLASASTYCHMKLPSVFLRTEVGEDLGDASDVRAGCVDPSFIVIYKMEYSYRSLPHEEAWWLKEDLSIRSRLNSEGPLPIFQAGYQLDRALSQRAFDAYVLEQGIEALLQEITDRIEMNPEKPEGMTKLAYRNRKA